MEEGYTPVNCDFYDQLEAFSVLRTPCEIMYRDHERKTMAKGRIADLFVLEKVEYMKLDTGLQIRLDNIIQINGIGPSNYC